jgi:hypothetical protein
MRLQSDNAVQLFLQKGKTDDDASCTERPVKRKCTHAQNNLIVENALNGPFHEKMANQLRNNTDSSLAFEMDLARHISGGLLSSRFSSHTMSPSGSSDDGPNRLRIKIEKTDVFPTFSGCPSWARPLLIQEYQVPIAQTY